MGQRGWLYFPSLAAPGGIRALLRTGSPGSYQYWVGGDRPEPFGPLPAVAGILPRTIQATGPGPDDWVVCYAYDGGDITGSASFQIAFADVTGIIKTRIVPQISNPSAFMLTQSKGNFASHLSGYSSIPLNDRVFRWTSLDAEESEGITVPGAGQFAQFVLPDKFAADASVTSVFLAKNAIPDPTLAYSFFSSDTTPKTQRLYQASGSAIPISPPINDVSLFFPASAFVDLVLYLWSIPGAFNNTNSPQTTTGVLNCTLNRWQINLDGTWEALSPITVGYQSNADYFRVDLSYYPPS